MTDDQSRSGTEHSGGTPGAMAEDHIRVEDGPIKVNYHGRARGGHGEYSAQCPICEGWHRWHNEGGAIKEAKRCCGSNRSVDTGDEQTDD